MGDHAKYCKDSNCTFPVASIAKDHDALGPPCGGLGRCRFFMRIFDQSYFIHDVRKFSVLRSTEYLRSRTDGSLLQIEVRD